MALVPPKKKSWIRSWLQITLLQRELDLIQSQVTKERFSYKGNNAAGLEIILVDSWGIGDRFRFVSSVAVRPPRALFTVAQPILSRLFRNNFHRFQCDPVVRVLMSSVTEGLTVAPAACAPGRRERAMNTHDVGILLIRYIRNSIMDSLQRG